MTDARHRGFWHRKGLVGGAGALLLLASVTEGWSCSDSETGTPTGTTATSERASSSASGTGGGGTGGGTGSGTGGGGGAANESVDVACNSEAFNTPLDATPDPEGGLIYFTAFDTKGAPQVFKGSSSGGACTVLTKDPNPLVSPFGIAVSTDGTKLYVADPGSEDATTDNGHIFSVDVGTGVVAPVTGTEGNKARSIELVKDANGDLLYFAGTNKADGQPGVFKIPASGGAASVVAKGAPFVDPSGIAVASNGDVYVCDTSSAPDKTANVLRIVGGSASPFVTSLRLKVSYPCGIALSLDEQTVLVSGYSPSTDTDAIVKIDVATKEATYLTTNIDKFLEPAGMHRAKAAPSFAWVDSKAQPANSKGIGAVFTVKLGSK